jgi:uncharacterized protein (TIGR02284 family)
MSHPSKDLKVEESSLRSVIDILIDSQDGFQKIAEELEDEGLKRWFLEESLRRAEFRGDLETILHQEGVHDIEEGGTAAGTVNRVWVELKAKLGGGDHTILATAEEGEDAAKAAYAEALATFLPHPVRELLTRQGAHIEESHDFIKAARDKAARDSSK